MKRAIVVLAALSALGAQSRPSTATCAQRGPSILLPAVPEASGIARAGGVWWTHNDSGPPVVFRLDASGRSTPVTVPGADVEDWEDLASGACAAGTCLYVGDIGDNRGARERITIYQVPLPAPGGTSTKPAAAIHLEYPDDPHDAEALLITKAMGIFVITKDVPSRVYQIAASLKPGETGTLRLFRTLKEKVRMTGAAVSPDERWIALRSNSTLLLYTIDAFAKGGDPIRVDLAGLREPQGEGVAFGAGGDVYLVSEGRGMGAAGILTRVHCAFIR